MSHGWRGLVVPTITCHLHLCPHPCPILVSPASTTLKPVPCSSEREKIKQKGRKQHLVVGTQPGFIIVEAKKLPLKRRDEVLNDTKGVNY